ncbi:MAG TPA: hypothetical protein VIN07_11420 [Flavipsychrobacter sp.]
MKKLLVGTALILVAATALYSCNNGPYDAHPDNDYSTGLNPLDPESGANVYLGSIESTVNDKKLLFAPAFYYVDTNSVTHFVARVKDDSIFHRTLRISFSDGAFKGVDTYRVNADTKEPIVNFVMLDTSRVDLAGRKIYKTYTANTQDGFGYATFNVLGSEGGHARGYMFGKFYRTKPEKNFNDTISMEFSNFYFEKVNFPVPAEYVQYLFN